MFTNCYETILRYDNNGNEINIIVFKKVVDQCGVYKENGIRMNSIDWEWLSHKINYLIIT